MSNNKMRLMVLCVGCVTLTFSTNAQAQFFEGCGEIKPTPGPEVCLAFFPDSGEYPRGLSAVVTTGEWDNLQEGDRFHVTGSLFSCGGFCTFEGKCFDNSSVLVHGTCPPIPTVSQWGLIVLTLLILVGGTIVIRNGKRVRYSAGVFGVFYALVLCISQSAKLTSGDATCQTAR